MCSARIVLANFVAYLVRVRALRLGLGLGLGLGRWALGFGLVSG